MLKEIVKWTTGQAKNNTALSSAVAGAVIGGVWAAVRQIPSFAKTSFNYHFTSTLEIKSTDPLFPHIEKWLFAKLGKVRKLRLVGQYDNRRGFQIDQVIGAGCDDDVDAPTSRSKVKHYFTPNNGHYWFWHQGKFFTVYRGTESSSTDGHDDYGKRYEYISLKTFGRDPDIFKSIIEDATDSVKEKETIPFYTRGQYGWDEINTLYPREMDTIYIPEKVKQRVIDDIERFLENKKWYRRRNIPYRRGYLFSGIPGTGKSSFVVALASFFDMPLFVINLGSIGTDDALIRIMQSIPPRSFVLIEDVDASVVPATSNRNDKKDKSKTANQGFSLSSFLNAIDGVYATDDRILIMTTNYVEQLDDAVIRPGRVDMHIEFSKISNAEVNKMIDYFYEKSIKIPSTPIKIVPAELQQKLIENPDDSKNVITWLKTQKDA